MRDPYMQQIIDGTKTYEFRKYNIEGVQRIWFYRIRPYAAITHVCEVSPAVTRNPGDQPIPENGLGNKEFNDRHPDWNGYDFAYRINSGIRWPQMRDEHGMTIPPRGRVRLPASIAEQFPWHQQTKIL
ncbi:hypothetical protein CKAH01_07782 [Colletotrichum kahawae]|uniref:ASCH domain-containing protein n=1 Tax=Colletotrichum kahawae TaxID=34407 RepID=A0AAD9Y5H1_COLKA|nr:hypothetical protein CKAH01_07782 [Colletotrichum kahawae]